MKHIYRGKGIVIGGFLERLQVAIVKTECASTCTVVSDGACFPIKEAMAVVKATEAWYRTEDVKKSRRAEVKMCIAMGKFDCAVAKMKERSE